MDLVALAGKVSHVNRLIMTMGDAEDALGTRYTTTLRIDGQHVEIDDQCTWVSDGDHVAVVGKNGPDGLILLAFRNDTTGYEGLAEPASSYGFAITMIVLGVVLFALIIGIFMFAWGLWRLYTVNRDKKAIADAQRRLDSLPRASATAAA